jgi:hypothetical protein
MRHTRGVWVDNKGVTAVLEKWVMSKKKEPGFKFLVEHGQHDLTGEWLVLVHEKDFPPEVVAGARQSLLDAGNSRRRARHRRRDAQLVRRYRQSSDRCACETYFGANFVIALAVVTIRRSEACEVRHRFNIPYDDVRHVGDDLNRRAH